MANYETLKSAITAVIKQNGNNEITGQLLQQSLLSMINSLGVGYQFVDIATPLTNPGTPDQRVFYIASEAGTYTNFLDSNSDPLEVGEGITILKYDTYWSLHSFPSPSFEYGNSSPLANRIGTTMLVVNIYDGTKGEVSEIEVNTNNGSGTIKAAIVEIDAFNHYVVKQTFDLVIADGLNTFIKGRDFDSIHIGDNEYLGIITTGTSNYIRYQNTSGDGYYYAITASPSSGVLGKTTPGEISYKFKIAGEKFVTDSVITNSGTFNGTSQISGYTFLNATPLSNDVLVKRVQIYGDSGRFSVVNVSFDATTGRRVLLQEKRLFKTTSDIEQVDVNMIAKAGSYIGVYLETAKVAYKSSGSYSDISMSGKCRGPATISSNRQIDFGFVISDYEGKDVPIVDLLKERPYDTSGVILELDAAMGDFARWTRSGVAVSGGIATFPSAGAYMQSDRTFAIANRHIDVIFEPTDSSTKFIVLTVPTEGSMGTAVRVNLTNGKLELLERYHGAIGNVLQSYTIPFTIAVDKKYGLRLVLNGRVLSFYMADTFADGYKEIDEFVEVGTYISTPYGYKEYSSTTYGYSAGDMQGQTRIYLEAGSLKIHRYLHVADCSAFPLIYAIGDSITDGFSVDDDSKYVGVLKSVYGGKYIVGSGVGSAVSQNALSRAACEITTLRPKYVLVYFGTNYEADAVLLDGITNIANIAKMVDAKLILCTIPTRSASSNVVISLAQTINAEIADFRDVLTSGGTIIADFYNNIDADGNAYNDGIHPNPAGHYRMAMEIVKQIA